MTSYGDKNLPSSQEEEIRLKRTSTYEDKLLRMPIELEAKIEEELREELGEDIANIALQQHILEEGNKKLKKKVQAKKRKRMKLNSHARIW